MPSCGCCSAVGPREVNTPVVARSGEAACAVMAWRLPKRPSRATFVASFEATLLREGGVNRTFRVFEQSIHVFEPSKAENTCKAPFKAPPTFFV